jgi:tetrahydromethanopterin S-methyltransferase subunit F
MFQKMNEAMEERLQLAREEQERKTLEISNAQAEMAKMLIEQSRKPENYQVDPPSYVASTRAPSDGVDTDDVIAAGLIAAGAGIATGSLAPTLLPLAAMACTMM